MLLSIVARRYGARLVAAAIVVFYVGTRLALVWRFPPHVDESLFATWTFLGFEHPDQRFLALTHGQQPLLEWAGMVMMWLGAGPLIALRLVSFMSGLATLPLVWYLGRRFGGPSVGLVAAGFFAVLPFFLVYSTIGLSDPLATLFVAAAVVLQLLLAERPRLSVALLLGVALGGGLLTKLTTGLSYLLIPLGALFFDWTAPARRRRLAVWAGSLGIAAAMSWAIYQVLRLSPLAHGLGAARQAYLAPPSITAVFSPRIHWLVARSFGPALLGYLTVPVIVAIIAGLVIAVRERSRFALFLVCWAGSVIVAAYSPFVRWLDTGMPPLVVLAAYGAVGLVRVARGRVRRPRFRALVIPVSAAVLLVPAVAWDAQTLATPVTRPYPGQDDLDYVRGSSAGGPWLRLVPKLRQLTAGSPLQVGFTGLEVEYVRLAFIRDPYVSIVEADAAGVAPLYAFENGATLDDTNDNLDWRRILVLPRPRHGIPVVLYRRVALYHAGVARSPDELRKLVRKDGGDYPTFLSTHPDVTRWEHAWQLAHPAG